jgi:hypothetical protein
MVLFRSILCLLMAGSVAALSSPVQPYTTYRYSVELRYGLADLRWMFDDARTKIIAELHMKTTGWIAIGISPGNCSITVARVHPYSMFIKLVECKEPTLDLAGLMKEAVCISRYLVDVSILTRGFMVRLKGSICFRHIVTCERQHHHRLVRIARS